MLAGPQQSVRTLLRKYSSLTVPGIDLLFIGRPSSSLDNVANVALLATIVLRIICHCLLTQKRKYY
jgi:hypothetical protein